MSTVRATNFQNAGSASVNMTLDTAGNATVAGMVSPGYSFMRNKIINGAMVIDQRNAGASVTPTTDGWYTLDRWRFGSSQASKVSIQQNAGGIAPPTGFTKYLGVTSLSSYSLLSTDYFLLGTYLEGLNVADLAWGTASASPVTLSFWVRASIAGTYPVNFRNNAYNRGYVATYTVNSANTWEFKTITIAGDTTGTWATDTNAGIRVEFSLGAGSSLNTTAGVWSSSALSISVSGAVSVVGTNAATWYITGVQLESGTVATPFEQRQIQQEVALCQRYFAKTYPINTAIGTANTLGAMIVPCFGSMAYAGGNWWFPVTMRANPTITVYSANTGTVNKVSADAVDGNGAASSIGDRSCSIYRNNDSTGVAVNVFITAHATANAEL